VTDERSEDQRLHRQYLVQAHLSMAQSYDRAVMTFSSGGLALSVAFLRDLVTDAENTGWLVTSWVLFTLSLASITASFLTSMKALRRDVAATDRGLEASHTWGRATEALNIFAGVALVLGAATSIVFASQSLSGR
jgi:hypothetical protein